MSGQCRSKPKKLLIFHVFANRAAAELNRLRMEQMLKESEKRYRDLFDEAPIPYVFEDTQTRFVRANRAAMKLLGLRAEDVPGTVGLSLVAPTPDNQERLGRPFRTSATARKANLSKWNFAAKMTVGRYGYSSGRVRSRTESTHGR